VFCNEVLAAVDWSLVVLPAVPVLFKTLALDISFLSCGDVRTTKGQLSELSDVETLSDLLSSEVDSGSDIYFMHSCLLVLSEGIASSSVM